MDNTMMQIVAFITSLALSLIVTFILQKKFVPVLRKIKMGQKILEIGPNWHKTKEGTPTMGGLFFIGGTLISVSIFGVWASLKYDDISVFIVFAMMLLYGALGFVDDFVKFTKKQNKGLTPMQKLVFQFLIAADFLASMALNGKIDTVMHIPFLDISLDLGIFYWVFSMFFIVFMVNAVNITDGIDGLAGSVMLIIVLFFSALAFVFGNTSFDLNVSKLILFGALAGGIISFLTYNMYPAKLFMGDTGSLFLGGALVGAAYWFNEPLIIVVCGFACVFETLSVVIQVVSYKLTKKRVFKMAPFHHHLEMSGFNEIKIVRVFALCTLALCVISYFGV